MRTMLFGSFKNAMPESYAPLRSDIWPFEADDSVEFLPNPTAECVRVRIDGEDFYMEASNIDS